MPTNNPLPSGSLEDFKDNAIILDFFVNSQENEHPDRFARKRPTITGIIKEAFNVRTDISNMNETLIGQSRWDAVPKNTSLSLGGDNGALNKQAQALFNRTEMLKTHAREALRRTYLEVGFNLVEGSFESGAIVNSVTDVVLHEADSKAYSHTGPYPFTVAAGTDPTAGGGGYVDVSGLTTVATAVRFKLSHVATAVAGAVESTVDAQLSSRIRLQSFGDPFSSDDADLFDAAILAASTFGAIVECPFGDYSVSRGINIKPNVLLEFQGAGSTVTKMQNETTAFVDGGKTYNLNTVFFLSSNSNLCGLTDVDIVGTGVTASDCRAVVTGESCRFARITGVRASSCLAGLYTAGDFYMSKVQLHSNTCGTHIDMLNDGFKTSLSFENCWAENCGFGYLFNRVHYASLTACGADYVAKVDGNPYPVHPWNDATSRSVYDLNNCRAVDLSGIGAENCCGQFVLNFNASTVTVNSIRSYNHESKFAPNYAIYPNYHVGIVGTGTEGGRAVISGIDVDGWYTNPNADSSKISILSYNYLSSTYGVKGYTQVTVAAYNKSGTIKDVGGVSVRDVRTDVLLLNALKKDPEYSEKISGGNHVTYSSRVLTASMGTQVIIPFTSQGSAWQPHLLKVSVLTNAYNASLPESGYAQFGVSSLTSVTVTQHQVLGIISSVTTSGMNVILNLSAAYTGGLHLVIELLHQGNSKLNEPGVTMN